MSRHKGSYNSLKDLIKVFDGKVHNKPNTFGEEGEDHINISLNSKMDVGRFLDPSYSHYFVFPELGNFRSPLNLAYWLRDEDHDDRLRYLKKKELNKLAKVKKFPPLTNYKCYLLIATALRLKDKQDIVSKIRKMPRDIRILSYRIHGSSNLRITTGYANIVIPVVEEIFNSIWDDRAIDINKFLYNKNDDNLNLITTININEKTPNKHQRRRKTKSLKQRLVDDLDVIGVDNEDGSVSADNGEGCITVSPEGISFSKESPNERSRHKVN